MQSLKKPLFKNQYGQVIIEYVLLLSFAATLGVIIVTQISRKSENLDESGALIRAWHKMLVAIGDDIMIDPKD